jgi:hypothetical protein
VKPAGISGVKRKYLKDKIYVLSTNSKNKIIRDFCRGIIDFEVGLTN